jgi:phage terminase Nu1 subunit (DNA packaging protein)
MFDTGKKDVQVVIPCHLAAPASWVVFIQICTVEKQKPGGFICTMTRISPLRCQRQYTEVCISKVLRTSSNHPEMILGESTAN